jgi:branched-subunit amino acid ABC-type transport system permease component
MTTLASLTTFLDFAVDGIVNGSAYGLMGLSFGLIVAVTTRFHFAWAIGYTIAGFFTAYLVNHSGVPVVPAMLIAIAGAALFSAVVELFVYRPIAARTGANALLAVFVASFGITIAGQALIRLAVFGGTGAGNETLTWIAETPIRIGEIGFTSLDLISVIVVWVCAGAVWAALRYTRLGRRIRAVEVNPGMAQAVGIRTERTYVLVFVLASLLASVVALFATMRSAANANMGLTPVFYAFVVAFAAGLGRSPLWIMAVGTALGVVEAVSAEFVSVAWQQVVVFGVLLLLLVIRAAQAWRPSLFRLPTLPAREG